MSSTNGRQRFYANVSPGSKQHAALRLLAAADLTAAGLQGLIPDTEGTSSRRFRDSVLAPLVDGVLVKRVGHGNGASWTITEAGADLARELGPFGWRATGGSKDEAEPSALPKAGNGARAAGAADAAKAEIQEHPPCAGKRHWMGTGDARKPVRRPGSEDAQRLPSRVGNHLHWPDGRVTPA